MVLSEQVIYVSRVNGYDTKACGKVSAPCRTISYGIQKLSTGRYIYLDGTSTLKHPYTCQILYPVVPGIYLNKSISFVSIKSRAYISCLHGYAWWADGTNFKEGIRISLSGLTFRNTPVHLSDVVLEARDTVFEKAKTVSLDVQVINLARSQISLHNVIFQQNGMCINIISHHAHTKVCVNITNTAFYQNGNISSNKPSILSSFCIDTFVNIQLRNCSLKENILKKYGMFTVVNKNGKTNVLLTNLRWEKNNQIDLEENITSGLFLLKSAQLSLRLDIGFLYNTSCPFLRATLGESAEISISNIEVDGFNTISPGGGGFVNLDQVDSCYLSIKDSFFRNSNNSGSGGILFIAAKHLVLTIENSIIHKIFSTYSGGAVYIQSTLSDYLESKNRNKSFSVFLYIANSSFSYSSSKDGGALFVFAQKVFAIIRDSSFQRCSATNFGGALQFHTNDSTTIILHNNYFLENSAENIIFASNFRDEAAFNLSITNVMFLKNKLCLPNENIFGVVTILANCAKIVVRFKNTHFFENKGSSIYISVPSPRLLFLFHLVTLDTCEFRKNVGYLGTVYVDGQTILNSQHSIFDSNGVVPCRETSVFKFVLKNSSIIVINTTFVNNFCNIFSAYFSESSRLYITDSAFVGNKNSGNGTGGVLIVNGAKKQSWNYDTRIKRVLFQENIGNSASVLTVINGNVLLTKCTFLNNFVQYPGGIVFSPDGGSVNLAIYNSVFRQTIPKIVINNTKEFIATSFLRLFSAPNLLIGNTTFDQQTKSKDPLIFVPEGNLVFIYNNSLSYCPLGQAIKRYANRYKVYRVDHSRNHSEFISQITFSCQECDYNFYSLQRGTARGFIVDDGFKCLSCPRGADCFPVIKSKTNYWGYHASWNPPKLAFAICPFGYCKSPPSSSPEYNACQGKRTGVMCGMCSQGYTEDLWSTYCTSLKDCNDHWFWILFLALIFSIAIILVFKPPFVTFCSKHILWFKRTNRIVNIQDYRDITSFFSMREETAHENMSLSLKEERKQDKRQFSRFVEIIFYFYQIAQLLLSSSSLKETFYSQLLEPVLGFFNFQPSFTKRGFGCPFSGLTPETKLVFKIAPLIGALIAIFSIYGLNSLYCRIRGAVGPAIAPYLQASINTIFLGYVTLATVSISLIQCVFVAGKNRWFYDGNILCYQWWQYASYTFIAVFVIPFIFVLALVSFKLHHDNITARQFIIAIIFPLPFLLMWMFRLACPSGVVSVEDNQNTVALKEILFAPYRQPDDSNKGGTLYWHSVLIARRSILVLIFCVVTEPSIRLFCMTVTCAIVFCCHLQVKPFQNSLANNIESLSLLFLIILGLVNLFKSMFVGSAQNIKGSLITVLEVFQWLEIVMLGLFPAALLLLLSLTIISFSVRVLFVFCGSIFNFFIRPCAQRWMSRDSAPLLNFSEYTDDDIERYFVN